MGKDYKFDFRSKESLKEAADRWRDALLGSVQKPDFLVTDCIRLLTRRRLLKAGLVNLRLYRGDEDCRPAYVTHGPPTLHCNDDIWSDADENIPGPRFVLGHELCHLTQHDYYPLAFSNQTKSIWSEGESGEWQANNFGWYFLISDASVERYVVPSRIAIYCAVELEVAKNRLGSALRTTGNPCPNPKCGSFSVMHAKGLYVCDACHHEFTTST